MGSPRQGSRHMRVVISAKWARVRFEGCSPDYIRTTCHGRCCHTSAQSDGTRIPVSDNEAAVLLGFPGVRVVDNHLRPREGEHGCPFHAADGLCQIHMSGEKPLGCWLSPFVLRRGKLCLRHRYVVLQCHRDFKDAGLPAYRAFASSLVRFFGPDEAARITAHLDAGGGDMVAEMLDDIAAAHMANEATLRGTEPTAPTPTLF
jgi:hypothetical protein